MLTTSTLLSAIGDPNVTDPLIPGGYAVMFTVIPIVIVIVFAAIVIIAVMNIRRARKHGLNPLTMQTDMAARFIQHGAGAGPDAPLKDRLAELEALKASGAITEREYAQARASALNC